ncbi:MAG TPA: hypothetical protein VF118_03650 [Gemmatimonadaceae bacterium]
MTARSRQRGFALTVALVAIVIIGALIVGVFFAATQEYRIGRNTVLQARALTAAEYGLNGIVSTGRWNKAWNGTTIVGKLDTTMAYAPGDGSVDTVRVTYLGNGEFAISSEGRVGTIVGAQARKRLGAMVALNMPNVKLLGALTTRGSTKIGGSSFINGADDSVSGWNCPPLDASLPGIAIADSTQITTSGCHGCIAGNPNISQTPLANNDSTYTQFGGISFQDLASSADPSHSFASGGTFNGMGPSYSGTTCNTGDQNNWGDPIRTIPATAYCSSYYPIIYSNGNLSVTGGVGQGMLLVNGDLSVAGGFQFFGIVIVTGHLKTTGTGGHFTGGVLAQNVDLEQNTVLGNAVITYSSCASTYAMKAVASPILTTGRSWVDLY